MVAQLTRSTEVRLVRHPNGLPVPDDFDIVDVSLPSPSASEVEVQNLYISVDPYMRGRMDGADTYVSAFRLNQAMTGGAIGRVTRTESPDLAVGDLVQHDLGWRTAAVVAAKECRQIVPVEGVSPSAYLGILGMTGWTAYVGLREIARMRTGDRVFVSAAAGAVGSAAGQFARLMGASLVIGSAGSAAKARSLVDDFGFDAAFNYRDGAIQEKLLEFAPDGIDVYFDNVGGDHLQAAWNSLRQGGRVASCGGIATYNGEQSSALTNVLDAVPRRLSLRGFIVYDHLETRPEFEMQVSAWLTEGRVRSGETTFSGIESAVDAFGSLFSGHKFGKVVVSV